MADTPNVYACIAAVSGEIAQTGISKDRKNQQQGYSFRGIDDVYNALAPMLSKHKLVVIPRFLNRVQTERESAKGGVIFSVVVEAEFDFVSAADGSKHTARAFGEAMDSADKATNKAMSAAYKYAAFQTFCIPTEGDNDADAHTHAPATRAAQQPSSAPVPKAPAGYDEWVLDLGAVADNGEQALKAAWEASKLEYRRYLTAIQPRLWENMKAKAAKGTVAA
jgi:hypothetical protein